MEREHLMIPLALEGRQAGRRVEEVSGNEEGVEEEVNQEGTKE